MVLQIGGQAPFETHSGLQARKAALAEVLLTGAAALASSPCSQKAMWPNCCGTGRINTAMDQTHLTHRVPLAHRRRAADGAGRAGGGSVCWCPVAVRLLQTQAAQPQDFYQAQAFIGRARKTWPPSAGEMKDFLIAATTRGPAIGGGVPMRCWCVQAVMGTTPCGRCSAHRHGLAAARRSRAITSYCTHAQTPEAILAPKAALC